MSGLVDALLERAARAWLRRRRLSAQPQRTTPAYLAAYGFRPDVVFDIGVNTGTPWLYRSFHKARFVLVDPLHESEAAAARWRDTITFDFHLTALADHDGQTTLAVPQGAGTDLRSMSSLRTRTDALAGQITATDRRTVPVTRLDAIAAAYPGRVGLKIDTEGSEVPILRGAPETLARCDFAILELSLTRRFDGVEPPSEALALLAAHGLELRDILAFSAPAGDDARTRHCDALFARWQ
jgi:FkbM family methyltransferase